MVNAPFRLLTAIFLVFCSHAVLSADYARYQKVSQNDHEGSKVEPESNFFVRWLEDKLLLANYLARYPRRLESLEIDALESFLKKGLEVDARDERWKSTPLMFAVQNGDLPLVKLLLHFGANPRAKNGSYSVASYATHAEVLASLAIAANSVILFVSERYEKLKRPFTNHELLVVTYLLKKGAPVNETDERWGSTSLMFAAQQGDDELVKILLEFQADKTIANDHGLTASYFAKNTSIKKLVAE